MLIDFYAKKKQKETLKPVPTLNDETMSKTKRLQSIDKLLAKYIFNEITNNVYIDEKIEYSHGIAG